MSRTQKLKGLAAASLRLKTLNDNPYYYNMYKIYGLFCKLTRSFYTMLCKKRLTSYGEHLGINSLSIISRKAKVIVGNYVNFNGVRIIGGGKVFIGNYFHSGKNLKIMLGSHDFDHGCAIPYGNEETSKIVNVGDFVWIGQDVTISGNVTIGEGAVVAIGSVVVKDVPPFAIVGGNPARVIKYRDIEHYNRLKEQGKFH